MVDYGFYASTFGGEKIPAEVFSNICNKAESYLDRFTYGQLAGYTDTSNKVNMCLCEMCEAIYAMSLSEGKEKKSENTDGYSVTYVTERLDGQASETILSRKLYGIADSYLGGTGLLYCGL